MSGTKGLRGLFKRNGLLIKMLLSILGLICIPLVCLQLLTVLHANREFKRESSTHNQRALASMASAFAGNLEELDNTVYRIHIDKEITKLFTETVEGYPLLQVAEKISSYTLDSPLISSAGIYYLDKDMILHNKFRRSVSHVCGDFFSEGSQGSAALAEFLTNTDKRAFFYTGNYPGARRDCLIIAKAISMGTLSDRDAVVFFVMEESAFLQWCSVFFPSGESFAVLDGGGALLMSGGFSPETVASRDILEFLGSPEPSVDLRDSRDLVLYKCRDGATGFTWLVSLEKNTAEEAFSRYTARTAYMLALAVVLMILLLAATLYINYKPVFQLLEKHFQTERKADDISELELIDSHFFALDQRLNDQVRLLDTFIMGDLVSGIPVDETTLERYLPRKLYRWFLVLLCPEPLTNGQSREVCGLLSEKLPGKLVHTAVPYHSERIFIYAAPEPGDWTQLPELLRQTVLQVSGKDCPVRMGTPADSTGGICDAYNSALLAEDGSAESGIPRSLLAEFSQYITGGSWTRALQLLDRLEWAGNTSARQQFYQTKLLGCFLVGLEKAGHPPAEREADRLFAAAGPGQLLRRMRELLESLEAADAAGGKASPGELRKRLLEFVDRNYTRSDLCLTTAADHLNTSVYTVSRIFKEVTGYGFKEYITERRLQQAVYLLRESDLPVADVAAACGFESTNYFTAVFRNKHGIPPAKYRRETAEEKA